MKTYNVLIMGNGAIEDERFKTFKIDNLAQIKNVKCDFIFICSDTNSNELSLVQEIKKSNLYLKPIGLISNKINPVYCDFKYDDALLSAILYLK